LPSLQEECPNCPKLNKHHDDGNHNCTPKDKHESKPPPTLDQEKKHKPLASWKYIEPNDFTTQHTDEDSNILKICTNCKYKATGRIGHFQLSHFDADHVANYMDQHNTDAQANVTSIDHPDDGVPTGPPITTVCELEEDEEDEMVFHGACYCHVILPPEL
jgi:hypothetical protein